MVTKNQKTLQTKGLVEYSLDETIVYSFITMYGYSDLWIKSDEELSKYLGRSVGSIKKQMMNIRYLMGCSTRVLSDYSKLQKEVFDFIKSEGYYEVKVVVKDLIKDDYNKRKSMLKVKGYDIDYLKLVDVREVEMV